MLKQMMCKEYTAARCERWEEREAYRQNFRRRHPSTAVRYPVELQDLAPFTLWLRTCVKALLAAREAVENDIVQYGKPPEQFATSHR